jgi:hypothetical protein
MGNDVEWSREASVAWAWPTNNFEPTTGRNYSAGVARPTLESTALILGVKIDHFSAELLTLYFC